MLQAGWENIIGILPVSQALLLGLLVIRLLRIELPGERSTGRLALVAGAFLTGLPTLASRRRPGGQPPRATASGIS